MCFSNRALSSCSKCVCVHGCGICGGGRSWCVPRVSQRLSSFPLYFGQECMMSLPALWCVCLWAQLRRLSQKNTKGKASRINIVTETWLTAPSVLGDCCSALTVTSLYSVMGPAVFYMKFKCYDFNKLIEDSSLLRFSFLHPFSLIWPCFRVCGWQAGCSDTWFIDWKDLATLSLFPPLSPFIICAERLPGPQKTCCSRERWHTQLGPRQSSHTDEHKQRSSSQCENFCEVLSP